MFHIIVTSPNKKTDLLFNLLSFHGKSIKHQRINLEVGSLLEQKVPFVEDLLTDNFGLCCGLATIPENPRKEYLFEHYGDFRQAFYLFREKSDFTLVPKSLRMESGSMPRIDYLLNLKVHYMEWK